LAILDSVFSLFLLTTPLQIQQIPLQEKKKEIQISNGTDSGDGADCSGAFDRCIQQVDSSNSLLGTETASMAPRVSVPDQDQHHLVTY